MRIIKDNKGLTYGDLIAGDVFETVQEVYIKTNIHETCTKRVYAVNLLTGEAEGMDKLLSVKLLNAELHV